MVFSFLTNCPKVKIRVKSRVVKIAGKNGILKRSFKDCAVDMHLNKEKTKLIIDTYLASEKMKAQINRICSCIKNMINGVKRQFKFIMKAVYAHFPINVVIPADQKSITVRNFLGMFLLI